MANTTISPNMNLPVPVVGTDPGPDWATNIVACLNAIDSHNHTTGQGTSLNQDSISVNGDFSFNSNNLVTVRSVRFDNQAAALAVSTDVGCIYQVGGNLYWNNQGLVAVQITSGNSIVGTAGSISGLPSGTAGVAFAAATYTFISATSVPAKISVGPIVTGAAISNPKTVTISASVTMPADIDLTWPTALPVTTSFINLDSSGNMGSVGATGTGDVVLSSSPTIVAPTITGTTTNSGTISGGNITGTQINNSDIGASTPATGTFSQMQIGALGQSFKMKHASGTVAGSGTVTVMAGGSYTTVYAMFGITGVSGSSTLEVMPSGLLSGRVYFQQISSQGSAIAIANGSGSANSYEVTILYI